MPEEIILLSWGAIGDAVVCTPALRALKEKNKNKKIILYAPKKTHLDVFRNNPNIDSLRYFTPFNVWRYPIHFIQYLFKKKQFNYFHLAFQTTRIREHIYSRNVKQIVGDVLSLIIENDRTQIFLTTQELASATKRLAPYKNVIIAHIHSRASQNHMWDIRNWNALVNELSQYTFIQIGFHDESKIEGAIDWRGQTTLREAFALIKLSKSFVGVDSSFSHVTNAFDIPGVVLFGSSSPVFWGHSNNINIYKKQRCSPCYYYLWNDPCPYSKECMQAISVLDVKDALTKQMNKSALQHQSTNT